MFPNPLELEILVAKMSDELHNSDQDFGVDLVATPMGAAIFTPSTYSLLGTTTTLDEAPSAEVAREIVDNLRNSYAGLISNQLDVVREAARAYQLRVWIPLGYDSWQDMCDKEFSNARIWQTLEDRRDYAQFLRSSGLSLRAIGAVLGVDHKTALADSNAILTGENSPVNNRGLDNKSRPVIRSMPVEVLDKRIQVIALTDQKVPQEEIAQRLGISQGRVSQLRAEFRESMANLPDDDQEKLVELFETGQTPTVEVVAEALGVTLAGPTSAEESALRSIVALVDEVRQAVKALHDHGIYGAYGDQLQSDLALNRDISLAVSLKLTTAIAVLARCARALRVDRTGVENIMTTLTESSNAIQVLDGWHEQVQAHTSRGK